MTLQQIGETATRELGDSYQDLVAHHVGTLRLMGLERMREFSKATGDNGKVIRKVIEVASRIVKA